jgi:hypothetical protein
MAERPIRGGRVFGVQHEIVVERGGDGVEGGEGDGKGEETDGRRVGVGNAGGVEDNSGCGRGCNGNDRRGKRGRDEDEHVHHRRCVSTSRRQDRKENERSRYGAAQTQSACARARFDVGVAVQNGSE